MSEKRLAFCVRSLYNIFCSAPAGVMELVDVVDSKSTAGDSGPVRVRPPAPARRKRYVACDELFYFIAKLIVRSFCCSSLPNRNRFAGVLFGCRRCAAVLSDFVCHRKNIDFNRPLANHWHSGRLREHPIDRLVYCTGWSIFLFSFLVLLLNASTGAGRFFSYRHITGRISL